VKVKKCALYRLWSDDDRLLYIGISQDPDQRFLQHRQLKSWWPQVARKSIEWHPTREVAEAAERVAIGNERPIHNIQHQAKAQPIDPWESVRQVSSEIKTAFDERDRLKSDNEKLRAEIVQLRELMADNEWQLETDRLYLKEAGSIETSVHFAFTSITQALEKEQELRLRLEHDRREQAFEIKRLTRTVKTKDNLIAGLLRDESAEDVLKRLDDHLDSFMSTAKRLEQMPDKQLPTEATEVAS